MDKKAMEWFAFGFGAATAVAVVTLGVVELTRHIIRKQKEHACCECCMEEEDEDEIVEKSINAHDEVVGAEFDRNTEVFDAV